MQEPPPDSMTEERRRELIEMGFPDDGYDYLKHMRAPGRGGRANLEGMGPVAESAPGEDIMHTWPAGLHASGIRDSCRTYNCTASLDDRYME